MSRGLISARSTFQEVIDVPVPERTSSYGPISNYDVLDIATHEIKERGLVVDHWEYSLGAEGQNMAAVAVLEEEFAPDHKFMVATVNSYNKTKALLAAAGDKVGACSNLMIWGDHQARRKHTSGMSRMEAMRIFRDVMVRAIGDLEDYGEWVNALQGYEIKDEYTMKLILFDAYDKGVLSGTQVAKIYDIWVKGENDELPEVSYDPTLFGLKGALTQLGRKNSLVALTGRSVGIEGFLRNLQGNMDRRSDILDWGWD